MSLMDKLKIKKGVKDDKQASQTKTEENVVISQDDKVKKDTADKKSLAKKNEKKISPLTFKILIKPVISEKAAINESLNTYTFVVNSKATKVDIKNAVKEAFGVLPQKVRVLNNEGKINRHGRYIGRRKDWKKAMVTLPKGKSINIHSGV